MKSWLSFHIDREHGSDVALVTISRVTDDGFHFHRTRLEQYETASKGATASARRSMKKFEGGAA